LSTTTTTTTTHREAAGCASCSALGPGGSLPGPPRRDSGAPSAGFSSPAEAPQRPLEGKGGTDQEKEMGSPWLMWTLTHDPVGANNVITTINLTTANNVITLQFVL